MDMQAQVIIKLLCLSIFVLRTRREVADLSELEAKGALSKKGQIEGFVVMGRATCGLGLVSRA